MLQDDRPFRILVLGIRCPARAVIAHALVGFGHGADESWAPPHAMARLAPGRFDAIAAEAA